MQNFMKMPEREISLNKLSGLISITAIDYDLAPSHMVTFLIGENDAVGYKFSYQMARKLLSQCTVDLYKNKDLSIKIDSNQTDHLVFLINLENSFFSNQQLHDVLNYAASPNKQRFSNLGKTA